MHGNGSNRGFILAHSAFVAETDRDSMGDRLLIRRQNIRNVMNCDVIKELK